MSAKKNTTGKTRPSSRTRLIDAASSLIYEHGHPHVSLDQVLAESGVCRSNFYYHFQGKDELVLAVVDRWLQDIREDLVAPILADDSLGALARVSRVLEALAGRLDDRGCGAGCPFGSLASAEADSHPRLRLKLQEVFDGFEALFTELFQAAADTGELREDAPPAGDLARMILAAIQGGFLLSKTYHECSRLRGVGATILALVARSHPAPVA